MLCTLLVCIETIMSLCTHQQCAQHASVFNSVHLTNRHLVHSDSAGQAVSLEDDEGWRWYFKSVCVGYGVCTS
jgi:hypothetical protein